MRECLTLAKSEALLISKTPPGTLNLKRGFPSGGTFFYLTRPLLLGEAPPLLLNPPLLRRGGLKAWPAGPVRANKLSP